MVNTPAILNKRGSNISLPGEKNFIIKYSSLVRSNKITAMVTQKEKALFLPQNRNNIKRSINKNIQNNGLKKEKLKFLNSSRC
jgi:hypothetical protein